MAGSPERLKPDSVVEALLEVRFESTDIIDLIAAKLATIEFRDDLTLVRLPPADLPAPMRRAEPNLAFQALYQLQSTDGTRSARVGEQTFSWHVLAPYPGWDTVRSELHQSIGHLFKKVAGVRIVRIGLRYINVLRAQDHHVEGIDSTTLTIKQGDTSINQSINLNYRRDYQSSAMLVRIATPDFVEGLDKNFNLMIDLDNMTNEGFAVDSLDGVLAWADAAHNCLKEEFMSLIRPDVLSRLAEA